MRCLSFFFQYFWSTVDKDVTSSILSWLNSGTLPHPINHTFITLISKTNNPEYVHQYRQISLYNVLYKIFSKVLANRLKNILSKIMTEHQSAFTKDRLISNNSLVAFETLHCMHKHNFDNIGFMAFKLNMSKAYDRVDWTLLEELIRKMGFNERFIALTMICVKTVTYSILVNREPKGFIQPFKRIRQGNPLSPFLFLLCTEGLNGFIKHVEMNGDIHGFSLCRNGQELTHLLFVDDSLLFCRATEEECGKVLNILEAYEGASGQKVNRSKTTLFFLANPPQMLLNPTLNWP